MQKPEQLNPDEAVYREVAKLAYELWEKGRQLSMKNTIDWYRPKDESHRGK